MNQYIDTVRVAAAGTTGFVGSLTLGALNHLVGIAVGIITFAYVARKMYLMEADARRRRREGKPFVPPVE